MVPPVNAYGALNVLDTAEPVLRPTLMVAPASPKRARMRLHVRQGRDGVAVDVEGDLTERGVAVLDGSRAAVADAEDVLSQRNRAGRRTASVPRHP